MVINISFVSLLSLACAIHAVAGGCPNGWSSHDGACYIFMKEPYYWFNAHVACQLLGGHLVEINSAEEDQFVAGLVHTHGDPPTWIGLNDLAEEGVFVLTTSGERPGYINWEPGQPDDTSAFEDCVDIHSGGWNDAPCQGTSHPFICEKRDDAGEIVG